MVSVKAKIVWEGEAENQLDAQSKAEDWFKERLSVKDNWELFDVAIV